MDSVLIVPGKKMRAKENIEKRKRFIRQDGGSPLLTSVKQYLSQALEKEDVNFTSSVKEMKSLFVSSPVTLPIRKDKLFFRRISDLFLSTPNFTLQNYYLRSLQSMFKKTLDVRKDTRDISHLLKKKPIPTDKELYDRLSSETKAENKENTDAVNKRTQERGAWRANNIYSAIGNIILSSLSSQSWVEKGEEQVRESERKLVSGLDYGCGDGHTGNELFTKLGVTEKYGMDIIPPILLPGKTKSNSFPLTYSLAENKFSRQYDIIMCNMMLHHVEPTKLLPILVKNLLAAITPGGYLLVREHNLNIPSDKLFIDLEHILYSYRGDEFTTNSSYQAEEITYATPVINWINMLEKGGLSLVALVREGEISSRTGKLVFNVPYSFPWLANAATDKSSYNDPFILLFKKN